MAGLKPTQELINNFADLDQKVKTFYGEKEIAESDANALNIIRSAIDIVSTLNTSAEKHHAKDEVQDRSNAQLEAYKARYITAAYFLAFDTANKARGYFKSNPVTDNIPNLVGAKEIDAALKASCMETYHSFAKLELVKKQKFDAVTSHELSMALHRVERKRKDGSEGRLEDGINLVPAIQKQKADVNSTSELLKALEAGQKLHHVQTKVAAPKLTRNDDINGTDYFTKAQKAEYSKRLTEEQAKKAQGSMTQYNDSIKALQAIGQSQWNARYPQVEEAAPEVEPTQALKI